MGELQEYDRMSIVEMREKIVAQLKLNYAHDNIDEAELERMLEEAHEAKSKLQLIAVVKDLSRLDEKSGQTQAKSLVRLNEGHVQEQDTMVAILGGSERKGVWRPARKTSMTAFLGGIDLDYTEAEFPPGVTEVSIFAFMGGVEMRVPDELNVEVQAVPILGGVENHARAGDPDGPTLKVKAVAVLAALEIKTDRKRRKR